MPESIAGLGQENVRQKNAGGIRASALASVVLPESVGKIGSFPQIQSDHRAVACWVNFHASSSFVSRPNPPSQTARANPVRALPRPATASPEPLHP